jgi:CubicO group peptidase (beta-lactamase class C family)
MGVLYTGRLALVCKTLGRVPAVQSSMSSNPVVVSRRSALIICGLSALGWPFVRRGEPGAELEFQKLLRLAAVPSVSYVVVDGDRVQVTPLGVRRAGTSERVTADTVYAAASLSKSVFAYAVLGLVVEGVLSLDRPAREYLPLPSVDSVYGARITVRHLLSHSSGWYNWRNDAAQVLTASFEPGTRWRYSGEGFFFLQRIVEKVTGKSVATVVRERVFDPLGMTRSSMVLLESLEGDLALPHDMGGEPATDYGRTGLEDLRRMMVARGQTVEAAKVEDSENALRKAAPHLPVLPNYLVPNAAGSLRTSARDFGLFLRHLVTARRRGGQPAAIVSLMTTSQVRCNEAIQWGLGVGLESLGGHTYAWQWGDNPGYKNVYFADLEGERALAVFTNGDRGARVYERVVRSVSGEDHPGFLWS